MIDNPVIVAVIPAYNEGDRIADTVSSVCAIDAISQVIVIDDGSQDDTARWAKDAGATVIQTSHNLGKGGALNAGVRQCQDADIVLLLDGDLGSSACQATTLIGPVVQGCADMSIASFPKAGKAGFGLVKNLAAKEIALAGDGWVPSAPLSGQRAITRQCLDDILPFESGYGVEVVLSVRALRCGYQLCEVETTMTHAATGRDLAGFIHRGKQFIHVWRACRKLKKEQSE